MQFARHNTELHFIYMVYTHYQQEEKNWLSDLFTYLAYLQHDSIENNQNHDLNSNQEYQLLALTYTLMAYAINDKNHIASNNLSHSYAKIGSFDLAEYYALKSIQEAPLFLMSRYNLGLIYYKQGRLKEARAQFEIGLNIITHHDDSLVDNDMCNKIKDALAKVETANYDELSDTLFSDKQFLDDKILEKSYNMICVIQSLLNSLK